MKNKFSLLIVLFSMITGFANAQAIFAESISTPDGSINFLIGFSPSSVQQVTRSDNTVYSTVKLVLINDETAQEFEWADYKMMVLTKSGELFYNYSTTAEGGDYDCTYTLKPGETKTQMLCYSKTFKPEDVARVWVSMSDNISFELVLTE